MQPEIAKEVDFIFIIIIAISVFFLLLITAAMIYFVFRYNKKRHPVAENITGNTTLEVLWTVIPLVLVIIIFFYGWSGFKMMRNVPPDAMIIKVTGRMWKWSFEYENKKTSDSLLYVPVSRPIKMEITSGDVNHSFFLPAYRTKEDAIPGRTNYIWFQPTNVGEYQIMCAEYCGMNHSYMLGRLIVMPDAEFNKWVNTMPPQDSLKKLDSLKNLSMPKDSLKIDTAKSKSDSLKPKDAPKKDTLKK